MATIEQQLTQLESDRQDLVDNLETKGITGLTGDETFTELVPEVLNISGGGGANLDDYFKSSITGNGTSSYNGILRMVKTIPSTTTVTGTTLQNAFRSSYSLESIPLLNTSNITNMDYTFYGCSNLTSIPLLDTSKVTSMQQTFYDCTSLTSIPLIDTGKVEKFNGIFYNTKITTIPLLDTSSGTNFASMFSNCSYLTSIPTIDTSSATSMGTMFQGCTRLENVPVLSTTNVLTFNNMFRYCTSLTYDSINNILKMCANAVNYTGTKTLLTLFNTNSYSSSTIQGLSNYQDFVNAGWSIGW